ICLVVLMVITLCYISQSYVYLTGENCIDKVDKTSHSVGSFWTNSKCHKCTCDENGFSCCYGLPTSIKYPEDCTVEYDYTTCTYEVFKKNDRTSPCSHSAVGK
uniref:Beta-microseminoprotein n=1 Tax=Astyanax mexicanus TaxID=7994 RepID=A0A8B9H2H4_ASTMX